MSEITYRTAVESDALTLAELRWAWRAGEDGVDAVVFREGYLDACAAFLQQGIADGSWVCWIAEIEGQIVSHICLRRVRKVPKPDRLHDEIGYVTNVYTHPAYRGQGIGSALLARVVQWARDREIDVLFVWPSERAVPFYERAGFSADNEILECPIRLGEVAQEWKKELTMFYGVQYYPEHWPEERWPVDARMMQEAGVNVVRMGEFAWSALEPHEGALDLSWMDRAVALLDAHGIKTIMCTASRTPPPWVFDRYPGVRNVGADGHVVNYGQRYTIGLSHSEFVQLSQRIDRAVVEHFAGNDAIVGWQVDNEVGGGNDCYCERCRRRFHRYLESKYGSIEALNAAWGTHFWSFHFTTWGEVPLPANNPQLSLAYRRFLSGLNVAFTRWRSDLIRELDPGKFVTTNFQSFGARHTDYAQVAKAIDLNGLNHYPPRSPELILDYYRGTRGTMLPVEQFTRLLPVDTGPGWMRLWAYMAIAHGACGINYFRWRCCRWGQEQHRDGILPHDGQSARRYEELAQMGAEIAQVGERIDRTRPRSQVAIVMSYEARWALEAGLGVREWDPAEDAIAIHNALRDHNVPTDAMDPREDLSPYRLVFAPRMFLIDEPTADNLRAFVENGGTLCLTAPSGVVDACNVSFDTPRPGPLAQAAGIRVSDLSPLHAPVPLHSAAIPGLAGTEASVLADEVHVTSAGVLAEYAAGWRKGRPAITVNRYGKGKVIYVGASLRGEGMAALVAALCVEAGVAPLCETPPGLHVYQRVGPEGRVWFALNKTEDSLTFVLPGAWTDALSGAACAGELEVAPLGVRILVEGG